jgi:hypothetical protein
VVGVINSSFSTNFSDIGCAGEVHLDQHEDYDKFSIQVSQPQTNILCLCPSPVFPRAFTSVSQSLQEGPCYHT